MKNIVAGIITIFLMHSLFVASVEGQEEQFIEHLVLPGDTWLALARRYKIPVHELVSNQGTINPERQPAIGSTLSINAARGEFSGKMIRPLSGGLLEIGSKHGTNPWEITLQNKQVKHPYSPLLYQDILIKKPGYYPIELPTGFESLHLSPIRPKPGEALALKGKIIEKPNIEIRLDDFPWVTLTRDQKIIGINGTGAFFDAAIAELVVQVEGQPLWMQPWLFKDREWTYEQVNFTGQAVFDLEAIQKERKLLMSLWSQVTPALYWDSLFEYPIEDYVELTSRYGARRSVNGGPYQSYHEGTDFSAFRGTPVMAPTGGQIVLAEELEVRGNSVIIDHGLGVYSGYYHLHEIKVDVGQTVRQGDILGTVGSTGRSTGNHLHWDLLVNGIWVDPLAWAEDGIPMWLLEGWEQARHLHPSPRQAPIRVSPG